MYGNILSAREAYASVAQQAAVLFTVAANMVDTNSFYQLTIERFLEYFASAIKHSDRFAEIINSLTSSKFGKGNIFIEFKFF